MGIEHRDDLVEHPTYLEHIRYFFDAIDIDHMRTVAGMDLSSYEGVKSRAAQIYFQTSSDQMPPEKSRRWPENRVRTFRNWMVDKFPVGVLPLDLVDLPGSPADLANVRQNAVKLKQDAIAKLRLAFQTLMDRDPDHPQGYFVLAGIHWLPGPTYCLHHEPRYNSWHRVYLDRFEAALRSVPGCEDIRLPYWDVLQPIPNWLLEPPFDSYVLPRDVNERYKAGFRVVRFKPQAIYDELALYEVAKDIEEALNAANFEAFALAIERAHDGGHASIGPQTGMGSTDLAAFDPIFWFFHCNWERMWWSWQKRYSADTLDRFRSTLSDQRWLDDPLLNTLEPFGATTLQTIDASGYAYEEVPTLFRARSGFTTGNVSIERAFRLSQQKKVSIRVKNIERLRIPGSFVVHLFADGASVAQRAFFQSSEPTKCPNCVKQAKVNIDFILDRNSVDGKRLAVRLETLAPDRVDRWIPQSQVDSPTINVRELLISD